MMFGSGIKKLGENGEALVWSHLRGPAAGSHWCEPPWTHGAWRRPSRREGGRRGEGEGRDTGRGGWQLNNRPASTIELKEEGEGGAEVAPRCRPSSCHQNVLRCPKQTNIQINKQTKKLPIEKLGSTLVLDHGSYIGKKFNNKKPWFRPTTQQLLQKLHKLHFWT